MRFWTSVIITCLFVAGCNAFLPPLSISATMSGIGLGICIVGLAYTGRKNQFTSAFGALIAIIALVGMYNVFDYPDKSISVVFGLSTMISSIIFSLLLIKHEKLVLNSKFTS